MAKHIVILITSLAVLVLFAGCKPESAKQPQVQPQKTDILKSEIPKVEQPKITNPEPEPNQAEPNENELAKVEPDNVEPAKTEPPKVEPQKEKSTKVEPIEVKPVGKVVFHEKCAAVLNEFVNDKGMVNYNMLRRNKPELNKLLDEFAQLDPKEYKSWPKEDKVAFWINAYNIKMLKIIVDNYPIESSRMLRILWGPDSIRHIDRSIGGIWKSKFIVMDEEFTLSEIERRIFQKEFDEPRVFLAISLASLSGPPLYNEPYSGRKLNKQLDKQVRNFLSSPKAFRIDRERTIVYLSSLLKSTWHGNAFISKYSTDKKFKDKQPAVRAVLDFISNYISSRDVSYLELENYTVRFLGYDWTINDGS